MAQQRTLHADNPDPRRTHRSAERRFSRENSARGTDPQQGCGEATGPNGQSTDPQGTKVAERPNPRPEPRPTTEDVAEQPGKGQNPDPPEQAPDTRWRNDQAKWPEHRPTENCGGQTVHEGHETRTPRKEVTEHQTKGGQDPDPQKQPWRNNRA